ncbi:hypothetical protein [Mesorhizobium sp.]|uniref:hypothetical protein n=1 Tax=Mesorhizobium sp. TaxID=1871066 RepID=UPI002581103C|nr:hypothetical protein [Mesorhizobium sp.]
MAEVAHDYLDQLLECPYCLTIRLRIRADATPDTSIACDDCGKYLGSWDEMQTDFEQQGGGNGIFKLDKGRIERINGTHRPGVAESLYRKATGEGREAVQRSSG